MSDLFTDDEWEQLTPDERAEVLAMDATPDTDEADDEFDGLPYSPVLKPDGSRWRAGS